ncbi:MAG: ribonuclease D [Litorilituus sp.]|jgi:ribonuclease D|nr:ribonuclease D [Litorilituus sp.]
MQYQLIEDDYTLQTLCQHYNKATLLALDTEFVRTRTLYPRLGLLQVFDGEVLALIDPLVIDDLSPFWQLLANENITKVLHACSEDLEVFLHNAHDKPVNLIDSQIMMSFLGHGLSVGYAAMVANFTGIELDKSESRTDWTKRPLTQKQLNYACGDVEHLFNLYPILVAKIKEAGWFDYAKQETALLVERKYTPIDEEQLYRQMKLAWRLNTKQLNSLQHLAKWRYHQAKKRDLPLGFVVKEHTLIAVAQSNPQSISSMNRLEGAELLDIRHKGKAMLAVLKKASQDDEANYPAKIERLDEYPGYKQTFKKVKSFLAKQSEQHNLAMENIASKKQINQFLMWQFNLNNVQQLAANAENSSAYSVDLLTGWRYELVGQALQEFAIMEFKN